MTGESMPIEPAKLTLTSSFALSLPDLHLLCYWTIIEARYKEIIAASYRALSGRDIEHEPKVKHHEALA
jgi:hypothetical protein